MTSSEEVAPARPLKLHRATDDGITLRGCDRVLEGIRARSQVMVLREEFIKRGQALWAGKRVLFVLPVAGAGGGSNVVLDEAEAMRKMGVNVTILNVTHYRKGFEQGYPDNAVPVIYVGKESEISEMLPHYDAVIATWCGSVDWLTFSASSDRLPVRGYYIQDFEPSFFPEGSESFIAAWGSYTRYPDLVRFTKTEWTRAHVKEQIGVDCTAVGPSVNIDLHRPRRRDGQDLSQGPLRIAGMIRPSSPRRAPKMTLEILREVRQAYGDSVEIIIFGCHPCDLWGLSVPNDFPHRNAGSLSRPQMASLLNEVDVFVDFSTCQAMGLTAMEAMCCGAAVIVPQRGGGISFAKHEENAIIVDTDSREACRLALERLIADVELRTRLQRQAMVDVCHFFREKAAFNILRTMFPEIPELYSGHIVQPGLDNHILEGQSIA